MKKILYIVLDGLGDLPIEELSRKTPLEAANTPYLDNLTRRGVTGLLYPVEKDIAPESDIAVISLLGYEANRYYTGRGPLECFAEGLKVERGDLALRVNFATVDSNGKTIRDRRVGRDLTSEEASSLAREINTKATLTNASFEFKNTVGHRGVLVIRKEGGLSGWITNTDPAYSRQGVFGVALEKFQKVVCQSQPMRGHEDSAEASLASSLLNEFTSNSHKVLEEAMINKKRETEKKLQANIILSRDAGDRLPEFPSIGELYNLRFASLVEMPVERGIALLTGMEVVDVPESSGHFDVDYPIWVKVAVDAIKKYDGLYIHIKGPDEPAHDGNFLKKKETIEAIDRFFFKNLLSKIDLKEAIIAVTSDHSTPCSIKAHSADPVPVLICGGDLQSDGGCKFCEKVASQGTLKELLGRELLKLLIRFAQGEASSI